jgi:hypothetical protein
MAATLSYQLTGGASNSDPNASLGGVSSSVAVSGTAMNNLFDNVSADEASAGDTEYRAVDVKNTGDATATVVTMYMNPDTSSASSELDFGIEASPTGSTTSIANESTAPAGVSFAHYNPGSKLALPDIAAGAYVRVWIRRTISAGAGNTSNDAGTLNVDYA